jgi:hypothetical protein
MWQTYIPNQQWHGRGSASFVFTFTGGKSTVSFSFPAISLFDFGGGIRVDALIDRRIVILKTKRSGTKPKS